MTIEVPLCFGSPKVELIWRHGQLLTTLTSCTVFHFLNTFLSLIKLMTFYLKRKGQDIVHLFEAE